jgi:hypothetical protein
MIKIACNKSGNAASGQVFSLARCAQIAGRCMAKSQSVSQLGALRVLKRLQVAVRCDLLDEVLEIGPLNPEALVPQLRPFSPLTLSASETCRE